MTLSGDGVASWGKGMISNDVDNWAVANTSAQGM